jgi:alpha,alpha-trehalase
LLALAIGNASAEAAGPVPGRDAPPSILFGPLFERVALSSLFPDGKTWVDATPMRPPGDIARDFRTWPPRDEEALRRFVNSNFVLPQMNPTTTGPPKGLGLRAHIEALWPILTRKQGLVPAYSSLLPLPCPYVVPGGRFREIYYWDSYFTMLGFGPPQARLRRDMVDNFAHLIRSFGHVPNGNRTYYLSRSQPPFFFKMVELTDPANPARADLRYLPELRTEYGWWMRGEPHATVGRPVARVVRMPDGAVLNRYWDERDAPRDESYAADARVGSQTRDPHATYRNLRAAAESGWDFSSRWFADGKSLTTIHTVDLLPPDLNSLLFGLESAIARGCAEAGDRVCASRMRRKASARSRAIRKYLWNLSSGTFDDYDWRTGRSAGNISAAAFYPLFLRVATPAQAKSTARLAARELVKEGGLVTTNRVTGEQWDAPNGWAPLQWIAVNGLRNYGEESLARTIGTRWLGTVSTGYSSTGKLLEKYDVLTRRPGGGGEYPLQDGFGWTNGVAIGILQLYPKRADRITPIRAR